MFQKSHVVLTKTRIITQYEKNYNASAASLRVPEMQQFFLYGLLYISAQKVDDIFAWDFASGLQNEILPPGPKNFRE